MYVSTGTVVWPSVRNFLFRTVRFGIRAPCLRALSVRGPRPEAAICSYVLCSRSVRVRGRSPSAPPRPRPPPGGRGPGYGQRGQRPSPRYVRRVRGHAPRSARDSRPGRCAPAPNRTETEQTARPQPREPKIPHPAHTTSAFRDQAARTPMHQLTPPHSRGPAVMPTSSASPFTRQCRSTESRSCSRPRAKRLACVPALTSR